MSGVRSRTNTVTVKSRSLLDPKSFSSGAKDKSSKRHSGLSKYSIEEKRLPENFADRVLQIEMDIENDRFTIDELKDLTKLY